MNNMVGKNISFQILSFGPLVETFGERQTEHDVNEGTTIREFILSVDLEKWIGFGLSVAKMARDARLMTSLAKVMKLLCYRQ